MTSWAKEELDAIGNAGELDIAALWPDGTLRHYTTTWVVRVGDELYVRSCRGQAGASYQATQRRPEGRIRAGGVDHDATFEQSPDVDEDTVEAAYRAKYGRYGRAHLDPMLASGARETSLRLSAA